MLTIAAVYGTIGLLWTVVMLITMLDMFKSSLDVLTCAGINFLLWPLTLSLWFAKKS